MPIAAAERSVVLPEPTEGPITFRGEPPSPGLIIRLWRSGMSQKRESRKRILAVRAMRRMEASSMIQLSAAWARANPEAASWVQAILHERVTLEREQVARVGSVEPYFLREPLGGLERDETDAEQFESYLNEWRTSAYGVPVQVYNGKATEDGEFARVRLPIDIDMEGCPDFFETVTERAYAALPPEQQASYREHADDRRQKKRYVKIDQGGAPQRNPRYDTGDRERDEAAHDEAVRRYLLGKPASFGRVIPALDCAPIFSRGRGQERWELAALVERSLYYPEELLEQEINWRGLGDRKLIPLAYSANGSSMSLAPSEMGKNSQFYLYTAYLLCRAPDGSKHPVICWTVGGASTWDSDSGDMGTDAGVGMLDLYERYKLADGSCPALDGHPLWSYHGGLHTEDDSPDHYWQPWMWPLVPTINRIEGNQTNINAAATVGSFPGHYYTPDSRLAETLPEAFLEQDAELKRPKVPRTGEIEVAGGTMTPAVALQIGQDAWRQLELDKQALLSATASDQGASNPSGHALMVGETLAKVGLRHIRAGVLGATVRDAEDHVRILHGICQKYTIRWPLQTVEELPAGRLGETRTGRTIVAYDPDWVGEGNFAVKAEYPEEGNLALVDLEASLADRGYSSFENVQKKKGESDARREWIKVLKDIIRKQPAYIERASMMLAEQRGDKPMIQILRQLQAQQQLTQPLPGVTGAQNGLPTAALKRAGGGGPTAIASARGGIQAGQMGTAAQTADAQAQLQAGPGTGVAA